MLIRMKVLVIYLISGFTIISAGVGVAALTTDELTRLKSSGLREDVIRFMVDSGYSNVDRVIKLKGVDFSDETILSVIKSDLKTGDALPASQLVTTASSPVRAVVMETKAKVRIERYLAYGDPILQNSQDIADATIQLIEGKRLQFVWGGNHGQSTLDEIFQSQTFVSPFYWDMDKRDRLEVAAKKDNTFILRTGSTHQGRPTTDDAHYWIVYLTPNSPDLVERIKKILSE